MANSEDSRKPDLFDTALAAYSEVEPPSGLETRILRNLEENRRRRWRIWRTCGVTAAATGVAVLLYLAMPARVPARVPMIAPVLESTKEAVSSGHPVTAVPAVPRSASITTKRRDLAHVQPQVQHEALPRESAFPAKSVPGDQERALILLMRSRRQVLVALSQSRAPEIKEVIDIDPIKLDPLVNAEQEFSTIRK
jgi:hypothetical protein